MNNKIMYSIVYSQNYISQGVSKLKEKFSKEDGVTAIEYAVIAVAISGMLLVVFGKDEGSFVSAITTKFDTLTKNILGTVK